jgi:hypothetical protein
MCMPLNMNVNGVEAVASLAGQQIRQPGDMRQMQPRAAE